MGRQAKNPMTSEKKDKEGLIIQSYRGVIPPPTAMEGYEKVCPGAADRILAMAENDLKHKHEIETKEQDSIVRCRDEVLNSEISNFRRGQYFGFVIIVIALIGGFYLVLNNQKIGGYITLVSTVLLYFGAIMYRNKMEKQNKDFEGEEV